MMVQTVVTWVGCCNRKIVLWQVRTYPASVGSLGTVIKTSSITAREESSPEMGICRHAPFCLQVCQAIGVDPSDIQFVEAHGTGTVVGDSQELSAINGLYGAGAGHTPEDPLLIGSVKSNMGHCEGCSGLAGVPSSHTTSSHPLLDAA